MQSKVRLLAVCLVVITCSGTTNAQQANTSPGDDRVRAVREVNITSDSVPGWLPSEEQEQQVIIATNNYFSALDKGQYRPAYEMLTPINRQTMPYPKFVKQSSEFRDRAGSVVGRQTLKITWTKDPARAPFPGVYATVDVAGKFANIDRECGFLVLYQKPTGGTFQVMRAERNFIDNATARRIERTESLVALEQAWASLSRNCPNYASISAN